MIMAWMHAPSLSGLRIPFYVRGPRQWPNALIECQFWTACVLIDHGVCETLT